MSESYAAQPTSPAAKPESVAPEPEGPAVPESFTPEPEGPAVPESFAPEPEGPAAASGGPGEGGPQAGAATVTDIIGRLIKERAAPLIAGTDQYSQLIQEWRKQPQRVQRSTQAMVGRYWDQRQKHWGPQEHARQQDRERSRQLNIQQHYTGKGPGADQRVIEKLRKALEGWEQYTDVHYFKQESKPERIVTLKTDPSTETKYLAKGGQRLKDGEYGWVLSYADEELFVFDPDAYKAVKFEYDKNLQRLTDIITEYAQREGNDQRLWREGFQLIRHPSHVAGEAVYGAGMLTLEGGLIIRLDDDSGHYRPLLQNTGAAAAILREKKFFAEGARVQLIGRTTERGGKAKDYLPEGAARMSLHPDQLDVIAEAEASEVDVRLKDQALRELKAGTGPRRTRGGPAEEG